MSSLTYIGKTPDSDSSVITKAFADTTDVSLAVTTAYVNSLIAQQVTSLVTPTYVNQHDALRAHKSDVDLADANYVPLTQLGQANGVATLDSSGNITDSQIPSGIVVDRPTVYYDVATQGTVYLAPGTTHTTTSNASREFRIASITIADPGYPWFPLCFGGVQGRAGGTPNADRSHGNGIYGKLVVQPPQGVSNIIYALAVAQSDSVFGFHPLIPAGEPGVTPITHPRIVGSLQLDLYASCFAGSSYIWSGDGMTYRIRVVPAL